MSKIQSSLGALSLPIGQLIARAVTANIHGPVKNELITLLSPINTIQREDYLLQQPLTNLVEDNFQAMVRGSDNIPDSLFIFSRFYPTLPLHTCNPPLFLVLPPWTESVPVIMST